MQVSTEEIQNRLQLNPLFPPAVLQPWLEQEQQEATTIPLPGNNLQHFYCD